MNFFSIKFKFIIFSVVIICLSLVIGLTYFVPKVRHHEKSEALATQQKLANQLVASLEKYFQNSINEIEAIAKFPEIVSLEKNNLDRILQEMDKVTQFFNYYFIMDASGKWLSYPKKPHLEGTKIENPSWVKYALNNNSTVFLDAHQAKNIHLIVSGFATPIQSQNSETKAVLRGVLTLSKDNRLLNQIQSLKLGENCYAYLVDSDGLLLAHPYFPITYENFDQLDYTSFEPVYRALNGESGVLEYEYEGKDWIATYEPIPSTGWALIVQQPLAEIMLNARTEIHEFAFLLTGFFVLFTLLLIGYFCFSLKPLTKLMEKIHAKEPISSESFPHDEIGILASEFSKHSENLESLVEDRTKQLRDTNTDLLLTINKLEKAESEKESLLQQIFKVQKLESIGTLAGGIAHDFNNLLTGIIGYADLALLKMPADSPIREDIEKQRKTCEKAALLTQQLLAFSRKQVVDVSVINLNSLVDDIVHMVSPIVGETITMEFKKASDLQNVKADKTKIEQVMMNLIVNARDAMPEGGKLIIATSNAELDQEYAKHHADAKEGQYAMVSVTDTGHGMSPEIKERIFDPFFTTKSIGKGTGLGLATVYGIVKQHEGYIWVYSEPEQGTTFKIYLPVVGEKVSKIDESQDVKDLKGTEKILVAEDDNTVREYIEESLKYYGYQVSTQSSPKRALEIIDSGEEYDLLLTDVVMPDMNGKELATAIRKRIPSIKVIFMSGYQDKIISLEEIHNDPTQEFIAKPIISNDLMIKIRKLLG